MFSVFCWVASASASQTILLRYWPEFHFCSFMGVMAFFAHLPVDAVSTAPMCTQLVRAAEVRGMCGSRCTPTLLGDCGTVEGSHVIALICC